MTEADDDIIPMRTVLLLEISIFPPIPMDVELTNSLLTTLEETNRAGFQTYFKAIGLSADIDVTSSRADIIHESHTVIDLDDDGRG